MRKRSKEAEAPPAPPELTDAEKAILAWYKATPAERDEADEGLRKVARRLLRPG